MNHAGKRLAAITALIASALISLLPWLFCVLYAWHTVGEAALGADGWSFFFGVLSFSLAGPLAAFAIVISGNDDALYSIRGLLLFIAFAIPPVSFQIVGISYSVMPIFYHRVVDFQHTGTLIVLAAISSILWYTILFFILRRIMNGWWDTMILKVIAATAASIAIFIIGAVV